MRFPHSEHWALTPTELAEKCQEAAYSSAMKNPKLHDEARLLHMGWTQALDIDTHDRGMAAQQAARVAALRRRTIEILLQLGM